MKKCLLIIFALLLLAFPVCADEIISGSDYIVNPLYEHLNIEQRPLYKTTVNGVTYEDCTNYDGAVEYLTKQAMVRNTAISLSYLSEISSNQSTSVIKKQIEQECAELFGELGNYSEFDKNGSYSDYVYYQWYSRNFDYTAYFVGDYVNIYVIYYVSWFTTPEQVAEENAKIQEILDTLDVYEEDEYTQVKAVYDYVMDNAEYVNMKKYREAEKNGKNVIYHSSYSALIMGETVCQGYATSIYRLLRELGISCRVVSGNAGGPHAWNMVRIGSYFYLIDATWDDQSYDKTTYFLKASYGNHTADAYFNDEGFKRFFPMAEEDYTETLYYTPNAPANVSLTQNGSEITITFDLDYTAQYAEVVVDDKVLYIDVNPTDDKTSHTVTHTPQVGSNVYKISALRAEYNSRTDTETVHENTYSYLYEDVDFSVLGQGVSKITGATNKVTVTLPAELSLTDDMTFENLVLSGESTIYANGHKLTITDTVTSDARLTVYGGSKNADVEGNTYLNLNGGLYNRIYGGGNAGKVKGNTTVILGGNLNKGDVFTASPCKVFGGGNNGAVEGKTSVTLKDNAVTQYLIGAGTGDDGTCTGTDINIQGGSVMNVYAGSSNTLLPEGVETKITMTGGKAEALFGGCESASMTGHTRIYLLGGYITRRIYTGCYNDVSDLGEYSTDRYIKGTTALFIGPLAEINTSTSFNTGIFLGSRTNTSHSDEINTLVYIDNSFNTHNKYIGEKSDYGQIFKSFENYIIKDGLNGSLEITDKVREIKLMPDRKYYALLNGEKAGQTASLTEKTNTVTFEKMKIFLELIKEEENKVKLDIVAEEPAFIFAGVYNDGMLTAHTFEQAKSQEKEITLTENSQNKIFFWTDGLKPLSEPIIR